MERKIIQFPQNADQQTPALDPIAERASFFADYELTELMMTIPQASAATEPKFVY